MRHLQPGSFRDQATFLRRQFLQDGGLPFTDVLTDQLLSEALAGVGRWLDRAAYRALPEAVTVREAQG